MSSQLLTYWQTRQLGLAWVYGRKTYFYSLMLHLTTIPVGQMTLGGFLKRQTCRDIWHPLLYAIELLQYMQGSTCRRGNDKSGMTMRVKSIYQCRRAIQELTWVGLFLQMIDGYCPTSSTGNPINYSLHVMYINAHHHYHKNLKTSLC